MNIAYLCVSRAPPYAIILYFDNSGMHFLVVYDSINTIFFVTLPVRAP